LINELKESNIMISKRFTTNVSAALVAGGIFLTTIILPGGAARAAADNDCSQLPSYSALKSALSTARGAANGGFKEPLNNCTGIGAVGADRFFS
jgi:hypothetical protein